MRKLISVLMVLAIVISFGTVSAFSQYDDEILFNDLPWGSSYKDVISALANLYKVSFTSPDYEYLNTKKLVVPDDLPFSLATGFTVRSKNTAKIADIPAYIILHFVFSNDGKTVLNNDINSALLTGADYRFWTNKLETDASFFPEVTRQSFEDASSSAKDLAIKLATIYGRTDKIETDSTHIEFYKSVGINQTSVFLSTHSYLFNDETHYGQIELTYSSGEHEVSTIKEKNSIILRHLITEENLRRSAEESQRQKEHEIEVANGNKNGL